MVKIHKFESTGDAYDACQTGIHFYYDEKLDTTVMADVETGDVLVIESEKVVGICDTWPVAVTVAFGKLHKPVEGWTIEAVLEGREALKGLEAAQHEASRLGYGFV